MGISTFAPHKGLKGPRGGAGGQTHSRRAAHQSWVGPVLGSSSFPTPYVFPPSSGPSSFSSREAAVRRGLRPFSGWRRWGQLPGVLPFPWQPGLPPRAEPVPLVARERGSWGVGQGCGPGVLSPHVGGPAGCRGNEMGCSGERKAVMAAGLEEML